jgi:hypothetical protein
VPGCGLDGWGSIPNTAGIFLSIMISKLAPGPIDEPPVQQILEVLSGADVAEA